MQKESKIEVQQLENGLKVPTFEGSYFCSRKNPLKEAETWVLANQSKLQSNPKVIILGLGAGFHVELLKDRPETYVIELREELIQAWKQYNSHLQIHFLSPDSEIEGLAIDFRPAWTGNEKHYENLSRKIRGVCKWSLQEAAEKKDLWILSEALKKASLPEQMDLTVKDIADLFPIENQTDEARIWRTLRELVA